MRVERTKDSQVGALELSRKETAKAKEEAEDLKQELASLKVIKIFLFFFFLFFFLFFFFPYVLFFP